LKEARHDRLPRAGDRSGDGAVGLRSSETEGLRRAMSRKRSQAAIDAHHERFLSGGSSGGASERVAEVVWAQIEGSSGFGFPKARSAARSIWRGARLCEAMRGSGCYRGDRNLQRL